MQHKENHILDHDYGGEVAALVKNLYDFVQGEDKNKAGNLVGIKNPHLWTASYVEKYHRYFPRTKIVFGLRHPVTWYNRYVRVALRGMSMKQQAKILRCRQNFLSRVAAVVVLSTNCSHITVVAVSFGLVSRKPCQL